AGSGDALLLFGDRIGLKVAAEEKGLAAKGVLAPGKLPIARCNADGETVDCAPLSTDPLKLGDPDEAAVVGGRERWLLPVRVGFNVGVATAAVLEDTVDGCETAAAELAALAVGVETT